MSPVLMTSEDGFLIVAWAKYGTQASSCWLWTVRSSGCCVPTRKRWSASSPHSLKVSDAALAGRQRSTSQSYQSKVFSQQFLQRTTSSTSNLYCQIRRFSSNFMPVFQIFMRNSFVAALGFILSVVLLSSNLLLAYQATAQNYAYRVYSDINVERSVQLKVGLCYYR